MCDPILVTLLKMPPIIVNPVVKMRPHPTAHRSVKVAVTPVVMGTLGVVSNNLQ